MPATRPVLLLICFVALPTFFTFFSLLSSHPRRNAATDSTPGAQTGGIRSFFSFHSPSSLFPPSAIISLTDDNSTFFLARPADFGPQLVSKGISGQLWVGNGFGGDSYKGGPASGAEGELGCSDLPGWEDGRKGQSGRPSTVQMKDSSRLSANGNGDKLSSRNTKLVSAAGSLRDGKIQRRSVEDGTDDHLHNPLPESQVSKLLGSARKKTRLALTEGGSPQHADIQSLQETAEITGKVVLLSRGGCGFLEKVKWAQRRGASALIVGDDTRGGALVTMYARGDTSNVTIPSLFTSHTTAHLLSSLIPPEGYAEISESQDGDRRGKLQAVEGDTSKKEIQRPDLADDDDRPTFTPSITRPKPTSIRPGNTVARQRSDTEKNTKLAKPGKKNGWLRSLFGRGAQVEDKGLTAESRRPPSSGRLNWINEKWDDSLAERKVGSKPRVKVEEKTQVEKTTKSGTQRGAGDGFEIGIQDWRDPDLVATKATQGNGKYSGKTVVDMTSTNTASPGSTSTPIHGKPLSGGSITPGSGEYSTPGNSVSGSNRAWMDQQNEDATFTGSKQSSNGDGEESWLSHVLWGEDSSENLQGAHSTNPGMLDKYVLPAKSLVQDKDNAQFSNAKDDEEHDGLWVTLTPTTMSTTPFFDTLLVLVVSPLVTLTVVYGLLLIRSRIRRRRWRAPKSVVEQLPVRTYQTMSTSSTSSSIRMASPMTASPTSPLLQTSPRFTGSRSRPRSRKTSIAGDELSSSIDKAPADEAVHNEKPGKVSASKRRYKGKQIECVVCLEEYVEGQSQVMSLPCGHEFHADCITPWLTTRRRTCPICKNDVVRSLAHSSSAAPSPTNEYQDGVEGGDVQALAAETTNDSPSAAIPIPSTEQDLERGDDMAETLVESQSGRRGWRGLGLSLSAFSGEAAWRQEQADRNR